MIIQDIKLSGKTPGRGQNMFVTTLLKLIRVNPDLWRYSFEVKFNPQDVHSGYATSTPIYVGDELTGAEGIKFEIIHRKDYATFVLRTKNEYSHPPFVGQRLQLLKR